MNDADGAIQPETEAGRRFVAVAEHHAEVFRTRAAGHDRESSFPVENIDDLKRSGGIAAFVPSELGGFGLESIHDWIVAMERLARGDASTAISLNMHLTVTRNLASTWRRSKARGDAAGEARSEATLRSVAAGTLVFGATATEAGTDFLRPRTSAERVDGGWVINGQKHFVTMSPIADLFVVGLRVVQDDGDKIGFAFIPAGTPGLELQDDWDALGMRGSGSQSMVLRDCRVEEDPVQTAGDWGRWNAGVLRGRTISNLTLLAAFLGIAERARTLAIEGALTLTKSKVAGPLAQSAGVQHLVGEIDIELASARAVLSATARRLDASLQEQEGRPPSLETAHAHMHDYQCAKWVVNQNAIRIVSLAMDICGGGAFMSGHELSRLYRDVRAGPFMQPFSPTEAHEYIGQIALGHLPEG